MIDSREAVWWIELQLTRVARAGPEAERDGDNPTKDAAHAPAAVQAATAEGRAPPEALSCSGSSRGTL